jgi:coatomer protein complex subunit gamma
MSREKRRDEDADDSPFAGLQKNVVLREARIFSDRDLNAGKCTRVLTKILYLNCQGEVFKGEEATEIFFGVTKLFQSQDPNLRRMVYLVIKELKVESDELLIVVNCLQKDMTSKVDLFRGNAIRVLAKIMDATMVSQIDRFLKQSLVDKNPFIVTSTLLAGQHLFYSSPEVIKRWSNEVQAALTHKYKMVQYHALALLYKIKQHDRLAISKVVTALVRNPPRGYLGQCLQIRIISEVLQTTQNAELLKFLLDSLHNKNAMVMYEAAKAVVNLPGVTAAQVSPAISVLQEFLSSPTPTQKFAAVRVLSEVVVRFPLEVTRCSNDLEHLITDNNRSIATLAITTLLKTGVEANVDRLMKSISGFMSEISDEFKIVLVDAIKVLCLKFPHKHPTLMNFLASSLREEGGFKFKRAIVTSLLTIVKRIPEAKEPCLDHFCEFIEDCEFPELCVKILDLLGDEGPLTSNPPKYIRFVFNRVILETSPVRAAAVSCLAKFGVAYPALCKNGIVLLKRSMNDDDDEVRDRAAYYSSLLENPKLHSHFSHASLPINDLEFSLRVFMQEGNFSEAFSLQKHLLATTEVVEKKEEEKKEAAAVQQQQKAATSTGGAFNPYYDLLSSIPELAALGPVFKSSNVVELTESETEYVVSCVKHIFPNHVVFQFNLLNNMEEQWLKNVTVEMQCDAEGWDEELSVPEANLKFHVPGVSFVCFSRGAGKFNSGPIPCTLKFSVTDVDPSTGEVAGEGGEDEYQLEDIEVAEGDYMRGADDLGLVEFRRRWETIGEGSEAIKKYSLGLDNLQAAVDAVKNLLGMTMCEGSGTVSDSAARTHAANMTGTFFGDIAVLARAGFLMDPSHGVTLKIAVRSADPQLNALLTNAIR